MARDGNTRKWRIPGAHSLFSDSNHRKSWSRSHRIPGLIRDTISAAYERLWGSKQPETRRSCFGSLGCVPRYRASWICLAEGWHPSRIGSSRRLCSDWDLLCRRVDSCLAGDDIPVPSRACLFCFMRQQRDLWSSESYFWGCDAARCAVHAGDHAEFRRSCGLLDPS